MHTVCCLFNEVLKNQIRIDGHVSTVHGLTVYGAHHNDFWRIDKVRFSLKTNTNVDITTTATAAKRSHTIIIYLNVVEYNPRERGRKTFLETTRLHTVKMSRVSFVPRL